MSQSCLKPCTGLYMDIEHKQQNDTLTISLDGKPTEKIFEEYARYKRGYITDYLSYFVNVTNGGHSPYGHRLASPVVTSCSVMLYVDRYPTNIDCKKMVDVGAVSCGRHFKCSEAWEERLEVVKIYFNTPTFDRITRDAKTNSMAKVSMIGGTFGLLTGIHNSQIYLIFCLGNQ